MNSGGLLLLLAGVGVVAYLVYQSNQTVTVAGTSVVPVTESGTLAMNCPGDPGCPGYVTPGTTTPVSSGLPTGLTIGPGGASTPLSGLGAITFRFRGPGGWAA
jgi:hypothetical protein